MFDTHIHGFNGGDSADNTIESLEKISTGLKAVGVNRFLPTLLTSSFDQLESACKFIGEYKNEVTGASIEGIAIEGPFFTEKYKGAQNPKYMLDPSIEYFNKLQNASGGIIRKMALAPERPGSVEFIKNAVATGVKISLGHSNCTYDEAMRAIEAGATIINHTYNAMSPLHHREPGLVGAAMVSDTYCELITDGIHVMEGAIKALIKAKGVDKIVLVSDSMSAGGLPDGDYLIGELPVTKSGAEARLKDSGNIAASVTSLAQCAKNLVDWNIANQTEALQMASTNAENSLSPL